VDALNRNPVGSAADDDDFGAEIQDIAGIPADEPKEDGELLCVKAGEEIDWMCVGNHKLYMLDIASIEDLFEGPLPEEGAVSTRDKPEQCGGVRTTLKRRVPQYFDKRQQLELTLAAQELSEFGDHELSPTQSEGEEDHEVRSSCVDIWEDADCLMFLKEGILPDAIDYEEAKRIRKRARNYCWKKAEAFLQSVTHAQI